MTRDEIIGIAREAGAIHIHQNPKEFAVVGNENIERFAALVAAAAKAEEREACAVIAETAADCLQNSTFEGVAIAIRARSTK